MTTELAQKATKAREEIARILARSSVDVRADFGDAAAAHSKAEERSSAAATSAVCPPKPTNTQPPSSHLADLKEAIGYRHPGARARELQLERDAKRTEEREEAAERERARQLIREELGQWSKDSAERFARMLPQTPRDENDAKRLPKHGWAICRMGSCGSMSDLAYCVSRMQTLAPVEAVGCMVVEAMGLNASGVARRQLYSQKARRKLIRSFALWMLGENTRLRQIAGSPSRRTVRGVKRVPQKLLARLSAVGNTPWHRSTTTRDANEAHDAGLWRRVRMRAELAHESERCGPSKQVVSRYWMELPRQPRISRRTDLPSPLGSFFSGAGVKNDPLGWVAEQGKQAIVFAMHAVTVVRRQLAELAAVPGMMAPLLHAPP